MLLLEGESEQVMAEVGVGGLKLVSLPRSKGGKNETAVLKDLKNGEMIAILSVDKDRATVVMVAGRYDETVNTM